MWRGERRASLSSLWYRRFKHTRVYTCLCVCVCVCVDIHTHLKVNFATACLPGAYIYAHQTHTQTHTDMYMYVCVCVHVCVYIYAFAYIHTYIYIYIYNTYACSASSYRCLVHLQECERCSASLPVHSKKIPQDAPPWREGSRYEWWTVADAKMINK